MELAEFDYDLPDERIAQTPIEPRDAARLLVDRGGAAPDHRHVRDLVDILRPGDLLVVNETKVIPARLALRRGTGGAAEVLMLEPLDGERRVWEALVRPARKLRPGEILLAPDGTPVVEIGERTASGDTFRVTLVGSTDDVARAVLDAHGEMPLPPYITERLERPDRYQTVYAREPGSAAAPTAGLHFTPRAAATLAERGSSGPRWSWWSGSTRSARSAPTTPHSTGCTPSATGCRPTRWSDAGHQIGGRVVAVGTTSVRALESAAGRGELEGRTDIFIHRPYDWQVVDLLMTNFHMPRTTLLMMIDAFVGEVAIPLRRGPPSTITAS
jgi:S-adenosylmethionine:tRNA ribosyltransferase-isomerase